MTLKLKFMRKICNWHQIAKCLSFAILLFSFISCTSEAEDGPNQSAQNLMYYFDRKDNGNLQVYSYDGAEEVNLVNDNAYDYWWIKVNPSKTKSLFFFSPKGAGLNSYTVSELMVFNIDGSNGQVIVPKNANGWELQAHAKWSPDGTKILGTAKCKDPEINDLVARGRVVIFNADGSNPIIASKFLHDIADPAWSNDGTKVVYVGPSDLNDPGNPEKAEIYKAAINSTTMHLQNPVRLTYDDKYCYDPVWSPDGNWIAYSKGAFANLFVTVDHDIYKCKPDGSQDVLVLADGKVNGVPSWTPDGTRLVFHVLGLFNPPPFSLYSCSANGGDKKVILSTNGFERSTVSAMSK